MKLSEAIIKGCEGTRKLRHRLSDGKHGCCVIGAACLGAEIPVEDDLMALRIARCRFPVLVQDAIHPVTGERWSVNDICMDLNDDRRWPRLSIAEWIANVVEPEFECGGERDVQ